MRAFRLHPATLAATCMLVLAGCGGVYLEHPLSDDETTEVDERLIGFWELDPARSGEPEPERGQLTDRVAVGKNPDGTPGLELVVMDVVEGIVKVQRQELRPTRIGDHRYLSLHVSDESDESDEGEPKSEEKKKTWWAVRYDVEADGSLRIWPLEERAFAAAVDAGELEGKADRGEGEEGDRIVVGITADTAQVRAWMQAHADTCVKPKSAVFRRLVKKASAGSTEAPGPGDPPPPVPPAPPVEPDDEP